MACRSMNQISTFSQELGQHLSQLFVSVLAQDLSYPAFEPDDGSCSCLDYVHPQRGEHDQFGAPIRWVGLPGEITQVLELSITAMSYIRKMTPSNRRPGWRPPPVRSKRADRTGRVEHATA